MLKFFQKRRKTAWKVCGRIVLEAWSFFDYEKAANDFFTKNPQFNHLSDYTVMHLQYLCVASGLIAVRLMYDAQTEHKVWEELPEFLEKAFYKDKEEKEKAFTPEEAKIISEKTNRYVVRFNQGIGFRDQNKQSDEEIYREAIMDVVDEVIRDIARKPDMETPEELYERIFVYQVPEKRIVSSEEIKLAEFLVVMTRGFVSHFLNFEDIKNQKIS